MYVKAKEVAEEDRAFLEAEKKKKIETDERIQQRRRRGENNEEVDEIRIPEDIRNDLKFEGQTTFLLKYVPLRCIDDKTAVEGNTLREWLMFSIIEEDPYSKFFFIKLNEINDKLEAIDKNIKLIPTLKFLDSDGQPKPEPVARVEREQLYHKYGDERVIAENELSNVKQSLQKHIEWRKQMGISFNKTDEDQTTETATWLVRLYDAPDAKELEDMLMTKTNWKGINLAGPNPFLDPPLPPWAGRSEVPDGSRSTIPDYRSLQINMAGVHICRLAQGLGVYKQIDRNNTTLASDHFEIYYGEYELGLKNGYGVNINDVGIYEGGHSNRFRNGRGRWDLADGTTIVGTFGLNPVSEVLKNLDKNRAEFNNPYLEGEPHGQVEINFGDGGYYKGNMINGRMTGQGDYQSALNEVQSGTFVDGFLHGDRGYSKNYAGDEYIGNFKMGELHGKGTAIYPNGMMYEGYWDQSMRHGRGVTRHGKDGCYRGYYVNDMKHGKGTFEFSKLKIFLKVQKLKKDEKDEMGGKNDSNMDHDHHLSDYAKIFMGYFVANSIANRGCVMNTKEQIPCILSRIDRDRTKYMNKMMKKELKYLKMINADNEKYTDLEQFIREEMSSKKIKIYNQQKHYSKINMYDDDVYGDIDTKLKLESMSSVRTERLKNKNMDNHGFKKARVPRLQRLNKNPVNRLSSAYERLKPDKGDPDGKDLDINEGILKLVISDFEEAQERQRFLKYDLIWQRAEDAIANQRTLGSSSREIN